MTTTESRPSARNGAPSRAPGIEPGLRNRRKLPAVAVGALCTLVGMAVIAIVWVSSAQRQPYLAVARPVAAGAVITDADLTVANLPEDGALTPIPLAARGRVVGATAATDLSPGSLLVDADVGTATTLKAGEALVSVEVPAAMAPVDALHPGSVVQVVKTSKSADEKVPLGSVITTGRVITVTAGTSASVVSLAVAVDEAPEVGAAAAAQRVVLVLLPAPGEGS